ncbi:MAG: hypothetical protein QFB87_04530 [Patescibacteria group bacterium]|nr:hypothetical protein [Patescibacteria group bacterium]
MPKISALPPDASPTTDDYIVVLDMGSNTDKKVLLSSLVPLMTAKRTTSVTSSATLTPNVDTTDIFCCTALAVGTTLATPAGTPINGQGLVVRIKDNGGGQSIAYNAIYRAIGVTLPTTTTGGKVIYLGMIYNSQDANWDVLAVGRQG